MTKERIIRHITQMLIVIKENPELFHDGIDEELIELLREIRHFLNNKDE